MSPQNQIRWYRKRSGLDQRDLAFLLGGAKDPRQVSRYEHEGTADPLGSSLFACEVIFRVPARLLFPETYAKVEKEVMTRAQQLFERLGTARDESAQLERKLTFLSELLKGEQPCERTLPWENQRRNTGSFSQ